MAAPIVHILFALGLRKNFAQNFIIGTSFPDIRYLGVIDRAATHKYGVEKITNHASFIAGMAFHQYVDEMHRAYWHEQGIDATLPSSPYISQVFKFYQDVILYHHYDQWRQIATTFDTVLDAELSFGIPKAAITQWHALLHQYLAGQPTITTGPMFMRQIGVTGAAVTEMQSLLAHISHDDQLPAKIEQFYQHVITRLHDQF